MYYLQTCQGTVAGSQTDWISQHTAIADYFRTRFYETHNLFPQFAIELGSGQNIYNFAYYGLYNPLYMLSWLFPFLTMETWFQIVGVATHLADGALCFVWLRRHTGDRASLTGALMLMFSLAVVYHTSTQVMFVNYLPFLLLMLIGADIRRETGKGLALAAGTAGVFLSSFYFALAGAAAMAVYIVCSVQKGKMTVWEYGKALFRQAFPIFYGGLLSLFYLVPVFCALLAGRSGSGGISLSELFIPDISVDKYLYDPYGLGLSAMAVIIICIWICAGKCKERKMALFLAVIFVIPVFPWILNGGLYVRSKAFLPFLPLVVFLCARFFDRIADDPSRAERERFTGKALLAGCLAGTVFFAGGKPRFSWKRGAFFASFRFSRLLGSSCGLGQMETESFRFFGRLCHACVLCGGNFRYG